MNPKIFLRVAAGAMIFHLAGHTMGHLTWRETTDQIKQKVISHMTDHQFPFMGSMRSMGDYFEGYGLICSIGLIFFASILWIVSATTKENAGFTFKILAATTTCLIAWSIDEFIFFFPFAGSVTLLAAVLTLIATVQIKKL